MKQEFYFHIPQPCHENWDKMSPAAKGCFCESCSKQVVDFSLMSDNEVLNHFLKNTGKVCGRFANDQLQRPFIPAKEQKKKTWWIAMMMPLLLLFDKVNAQKKNNPTVKSNTEVKQLKSKPQILGTVLSKIMPAGDVEVKEECTGTVGDTILVANETKKEKRFIVKGKITDEKTDEPVSFATVVVKREKIGTAADLNGNFSLAVHSNYDNIILTIASVGYHEKEIPIALNQTSNNISLNQEINELPEIIIANESLKISEQVLGGLVVVTAGYTIKHTVIKKTDTFSTAIRKVFKTQFFKVYPNPAPKGSLVHLELKKVGEYSIQFFDNNSKLILVQDFVAASDKAITNISIPSTLASGMYNIRVIDEKKKKQYTDKIIIQ
jgi:hypothetical protein